MTMEQAAGTNEGAVNTRRCARAVSAVLMTTLWVAAVTVLSVGEASAHHCTKPNATGNLTIGAGGVGTVGLEQRNVGTFEHDVIVCADPPHQEAWLDVRDLDTTGTGVQVGAGTCGLAGCTGVGYTGFEGSIPSVSGDYPLDGNNVLGVFVHGGSVCPWANGSPSPCQLGLTSGTTTAGGDPSPPVAHPAIDPFLAYMFYESLYGVPWYAYWCTEFMYTGIPIGDAAILCGLMATNRLIWGPLSTLGM